MRLMWKRRGRGEGVGEDEVEDMAAQVSGLDLRSFFDQAVRGTGELPLARLLAGHGIAMRLGSARDAKARGGVGGGGANPQPPRASMGVRTRVEGRETVLTHVLEGGAAQAWLRMAAAPAVLCAGAGTAEGGWP